MAAEARAALAPHSKLGSGGLVASLTLPHLVARDFRRLKQTDYSWAMEALTLGSLQTREEKKQAPCCLG